MKQCLMLTFQAVGACGCCWNCWGHSGFRWKCPQGC